MSSPQKPASPVRDGASSGSAMAAAAAAAATDEKPRLTEEEKKQNHIASEQKRRQAIREGFDRLTELVPGLEGQGRSEGLVLNKTVEYMKEQMEERRRLVEQLEARGVKVDDGMKRPLMHQGDGSGRPSGGSSGGPSTTGYE